MDAKLKALKVVDLKNILNKAHVSVPAKATKTDLIAKIQASKAALDTYASLYPPDDLLAPPEEVDWNVDQLESPTPPPQQEQKPPSVAAPAPASAPAPTPAAAPEPAPQSNPTPAAETAKSATEPTAADAELEKRRQRAARFGIPLVEPKQKQPRAPKPAAATAVDPEKLNQRAARFGLNDQPKAAPAAADAKAKSNGKKRPAPATQEVDPEELERRKKRAERFGTANKA